MIYLKRFRNDFLVCLFLAISLLSASCGGGGGGSDSGGSGGGESAVEDGEGTTNICDETNPYCETRYKEFRIDTPDGTIWLTENGERPTILEAQMMGDYILIDSPSRSKMVLY